MIDDAANFYSPPNSESSFFLTNCRPPSLNAGLGALAPVVFFWR
jgi:hypothetical protein